MLNISNNNINRDEILSGCHSYQEVMISKASNRLIILLGSLFCLACIILFLPWTQNIRAKGKLTSLNPQNREQQIHSMISGRVEKWYVNEGQLLKRGDTVVFISEMKPDYLDPFLIEKTARQAEAKKASVASYKEKAQALSNQIDALKKNKKLKLLQAENYLKQAALKVTSDSIDYQTAVVNLEIAQNQFERQENLYKQGLKSLTDLQKRKQKLQESVNKKIAIQNKWLVSQNEYINARINLNAIENEYLEKIAKAESDHMSAVSNILQAEADYNKLSIQESNYVKRSGFYAITAPQDGYVTRALVVGIGETVKEGQPIFTFVPAHYDLAVEMYVRPIDLPLIRENANVRLQFDGWPALVFSGWPGLSFGAYDGKIVAYDKVAGPNGNFRVLVVPEGEDARPWPELLRIGSGANGIALLNRVPVWYELWRNLNGFPPDFYKEENYAPKPKMTKK